MSAIDRSSDAAHSPDDRSMQSYLAEHPRMMGALFMLVLLLASSGEVAAGGEYALLGP